MGERERKERERRSEREGVGERNRGDNTIVDGGLLAM